VYVPTVNVHELEIFVPVENLAEGRISNNSFHCCANCQGVTYLIIIIIIFIIIMYFIKLINSVKTQREQYLKVCEDER